MSDMSIVAVRATDSLTSTADRIGSAQMQPGPAHDDVEAFRAELHQHRGVDTSVPEQNAVNWVQGVKEALGHALADAMDTKPGSFSPEVAVNAQYLLQRQVHYVDLTAKVAGAVSQSVNKLLAMQ